MCDFSPDIPKPSSVPAPQAPTSTARLSTNKGNTMGLDPLTGLPMSKRKRGFSSLTIDRDPVGTGLTIGE